MGVYASGNCCNRNVMNRRNGMGLDNDEICDFEAI